MADPHDVIYEDFRINAAVTTTDENWTTFTFSEEVFGFYLREKTGGISVDIREDDTVTDEFRLVAGDIIFIPLHADAGDTFEFKRVGDTDATLQAFTFR